MGSAWPLSGAFLFSKMYLHELSCALPIHTPKSTASIADCDQVEMGLKEAMKAQRGR